ncbi:MAG: hypothetical protein AAGB31_10460 [Bdellovibrio sp.]
MKPCLLFVSLLITSSAAFASWAEDFAELKNVPRNYEDAGSICEEIARLDMQREYPAPQYSVEVGIAYGDGTRTIGELDVVIFDNNTHKVLKVAEVKCWKDVRGGLKKAQEQRERFLRNIKSGKNLIFQSTSTHQNFDAERFRYIQDFFSIAQKGSESQGFDYEMAYTLREMHDYRFQMIRCQEQGRCARPE